MSNEMYCGVGQPPKDRIRGTPEYCVQTNQVRYYGLKKIDANLLKKKEKPISDILSREELKQVKLSSSATSLVKQFKEAKLILDHAKNEKSKKAAEKKLNELLIRRDKLKAQMVKQRGIVENLTEQLNKERKEEEREEKRKAKSASSKSSKKSSGSKSSKKSSGSKSSRKK